MDYLLHTSVSPGKFRHHYADHHIWICKTDINSEADFKKIAEVLNHHPEIHEWTVDMDDNDRVLRVITTVMPLAGLISLLSRAGFECEELPD